MKNLPTLNATLVITLAVFFAPSAYAEDEVSLIWVRDAGVASLYSTLSNSNSSNSEVSRLPSFTSGNSQSEYWTVDAGLNVGIGHNMELWGNIPYNSTHLDTFFNGSDHSIDQVGLGDLTAGVKYKLYTSSDEGTSVITRLGYMHHSDDAHSLFAEGLLTKELNSQLSGQLTVRLNDAVGFNQYTYIGSSAIWFTSNKFVVIPSVSYTRNEAQNHLSANEVTSYGFSLQYNVSTAWVLMTSISQSHASGVTSDYYANIRGVETLNSYSISLRRDFR